MTTPVQQGEPDDGGAGNSSIASSLERLEAVARKRPEFARDTYHSVTTLVDGLQCRSEERGWQVQSDLPATIGGAGSGPTPGMLGRAALGSCLAMGYKLHAERLGVQLTSIQIEVEADSDDAGMLFLDSEARPGYSEVRYHVDIVSPEPEELVLKVLDEGDALSPYRDVFSQSTPMQRTTSIRHPA